MIATTTITALMASVGEASSPMFDAIAPFVYVAAGIGLALFLGKKLIGFIPGTKK